MSIDRLIDLAKRTGDRLIIHDRYDDKDMVIMDVDSYEQLILGRQDVRRISESQLLDQINRDIAIWRANQELEDEFESDDTPSTWASAGGVLDERYGNAASGGASTNFVTDDADEDDECLDDEEIPEELEDILAVPKVDPTADDESSKSGLVVDEEWDELMPTAAPQPIAQITVPVPNPKGESEPLPGDEPVFYEEPV